MNTNGELSPSAPGNHLGGSLALVTARLTKLRHERQLIERAILALTEIARERQSRHRRATRHRP